MPINIFEVNSEPVKRNDDYVGTVRGGAVINGRPASLPTWRFTTGDPEAAASIAAKFGGEIEEWETKSSEVLEIVTPVDTMEIIVEGITSGMKLWGRNGLLRACDGVTQEPDDDGVVKGCECPMDLKTRKEKAKAGTACEPSTGIYLRIVDLEDLGVWRFFSSGWTLAKDIQAIEAQFNETDRKPQLATFSKRVVEFTTADGTDVRYITPDVKLKGLVDSDEGPF